MKKIMLIIRREYLTRVKKRSFIIMTLLGPLLIASVWIVPIILATQSEGIKVVEVLDETGLFYQQFNNTDEIRFVYISEDLTTAKEELRSNDNYAILHIPKREFALPTSAYLYSYKKPGLNMKTYIQTSVNKIIENEKLLDIYGIDQEQLASVKSNIKLVVKDVETGEKSFTEISWVLGLVGGMLIYMFIFMYGAQVMRGVIEEKTSRIIEVIVSSVKPIQLMMGKIIGIAMVGLTQFLLWIILTFGIVTLFSVIYAEDVTKFQTGQEFTDPGQLFSDQPGTLDMEQSLESLENGENIAQVIDILYSINYGVIIVSFLFFFLAGYLLYASLFAAVGAAVDSEADTQQFMFPITIPLILALIVGISFVINNPDGQVAYWMSLIPFTSPIVMMIRIPFGVDILTELIPSAILLILGFLATTWLAARIYRTGILMYGKKVSYKELWKWARY